MPKAVLATKLYIPSSRPNVVVRSRLIERLNEGLSFSHKLIIISAPAGFGKTTLVSEWIAGCERPTAWISLDEGDNDLIRFLTYIIAALQTIVPNIGEGVLGTLHALQVQPPSIESLLTTLINEVDTIPDDFILVLDDYHMLDSKSVDQAINFLIEHQPQHMHLVIATREDPPLPLARLRVRNQLTELRAVDLRFTTSEAADFLNHVMGLNLSAEDIATLEARTEGWVAGLQLAALSMQGHAAQDTAGFIRSFTGAHHFVLDYLLEEVLQQQPENIQAFLLQTSILNRLCGPLCDAVLLDSNLSGQETLESLERANLFIVALDNERHWYRYHHLFGDLLRQRQGQSLKPEEVAKYHIRASEWYEQNGEEAEAFQHAIAAKDFNRAAGLAEKFWQGMNQSFQSAVWLGWVKQLPESLIRSHPVLCVQIAWAFMDVGDVESSESRLRDAEVCLESSSAEIKFMDEKEIQTLPARIAFARAYNAQTQLDFSATIKYAEMAIKLAPAGDEFIRAGAAAILGGSYWANGDLDAACKSMSDWIDSSLKAGNFIFSIASEAGKAEILTAQGHLREALRTYEQSLQLAASHGSEVNQIIAHHHLGLALLHHEMGNDKSAAQYFHQSTELGRQSTLVDFPYRKSLAQARLKEFEGDLDAALEFLDEASRLYINTPIPNTRPVEALKACIYLKQEQFSKAQDWVRECGIKVNDELSYLRELEHIILARVLIAEYQSTASETKIQDALILLSRLLQTAENAKRMGSMIEILMVQAFAFHAHGESSHAFEALKRALTLAEPEGYFRFFVNEGKSMAKLLTALSHSHVDERLENYIQKLLSAFGKTKPEPVNAQPLIDPLSERELEVLRLVADGLSNDEIGQKLFLAVSTVKGHNLRIFGKLQAKSRTEAIVRARELGLLP
ncbi:MAG: helix-turn-helix transcriptional regulator [Anaerolineales bacterium]|nr:helix-turn-helix transcriptional regulator [Anaerolineales bacterium]